METLETPLDPPLISVFTTKGEYVTSFGQRGTREVDSKFSYPCGVCVDKDGFVYVCDCSNCKVNVFFFCYLLSM